MQLVKLDTLKKLLTVNEADDNPDFSYEEFLREYNNIKLKHQNEIKNSDIYKIIYTELNENWIKHHCPPIKFIAKGSSRIAYAIEGGKCLKVAINNKGIAQNKQEYKILKQTTQYSCFTQIYDFDEKDSASLITECCAKVKELDIGEAFGISDPYEHPLYPIIDAIQLILKKNCNIQKAIDRKKIDTEELEDLISQSDMEEYSNKEYNAIADKSIQDEYDVSTQILDFLINIKESNEPQFKVLRDLIAFYQHYGEEELSIVDLGQIENWGLAIREGKIVPVIIDVGLNHEIYTKYYKQG